jgi:hypothetical protein
LRNRSLFFVVFFGLVASALAQSQERRDFTRLNFNVGAGLGVGRGAVGSFVGNSFAGSAGAGMNFSRLFGVNAEYMYYNLDLRQSVRNSQSLPNATGAMNSVSLNGLVTVPYHLGRFGAYGILGVGFYHRSVSTSPKQLLLPGTPCQPAWIWWDVNCTGNPPSIQNTQQTLSTFSKEAGGFNYGGGITYRLDHFHNAKMYFEWRYHRAYHSDVQTIVWPVTVGVRW